MSHCSTNGEGLTFEEWVQAAGLYKPWPGTSYKEGTSCSPYSTKRKRFYPLSIRKAWRNCEDPSDHRPKAPKRYSK
jgi:hypothetical protein